MSVSSGVAWSIESMRSIVGRAATTVTLPIQKDMEPPRRKPSDFEVDCKEGEIVDTNSNTFSFLFPFILSTIYLASLNSNY